MEILEAQQSPLELVQVAVAVLLLQLDPTGSRRVHPLTGHLAKFGIRRVQLNPIPSFWGVPGRFPRLLFQGLLPLELERGGRQNNPSL